MKKNDYTLGVVSVSFRSHTPKEILEAARAAGLCCVEWGSDVHAPCTDTTRLMEIAEMQKAYGIACSSYGTYFHLGETPIEELESYITAAKKLGTDILRLWCGTKSGEEYSDLEKQKLFDQCRYAAQMAEKAGVTLCMECHSGTYTQRLQDALALMREISSPHFRMYWQPFQWQSVEENLTYAKAIAPFTHHIHVFQWKGKERFSLHDGLTEWREYLNEFPAPRTLLLEFMPDDAIATLSKEADALKMMIGERT